MKLPDFFIVGAPKCGTTTLYNWLGEHPHIYAPHKEPCFFSQDIYPTAHLPSHIPSLEAYSAIFSLSSSEHRVSGEATPKYLYSDMALDSLARLCPEARIIVCVRNPLDLVLSFHGQKLRDGEEVDADFVKAWRRTVAPGGEVLSRAPIVNGRINYVFWGAFGERLVRLHEVFPRSRILVLTLSELELSPAATYGRVLDFLQVEPRKEIHFAAYNRGYRIKWLALYMAIIRLKRFSSPTVRLIHSVLGGRGLGIIRLLNRLGSSPADHGGIPADIRAEMRSVFSRDVTLAESFLGGRSLAGDADFDF